MDFGWIGPVIEAVQRRQFRTADNRIAANRATEEYEREKEFAQMGIRWKVEDAKAAGLHPLAALGAQTQSYAPQSTFVSSAPYMADFSKMGQYINRAIGAGQTEEERRMKDAEIRRMEADAEYSELRNADLMRKLNEPTQEPPARSMTAPWMEGQQTNLEGPQWPSESRYRTWVPSVQQIPTSDSMGTTAGPPQALETPYIDKRGYLDEVISQNASEPYESDEFSSTERFFDKAYQWGRGVFWDNLPWKGSLNSDAAADYNRWLEDLYMEYERLMENYPLPEGYEWRYHVRRGKWIRSHTQGGHRILFNPETDNRPIYRGKIERR